MTDGKGERQMDSYEIDFEEHMLQDKSSYYSSKATNCILEDSCPDYMRKAEECLKKERDMVCHYLQLSYFKKINLDAERMIFLGCTGFTIQYLKAWNQWLMHLDSMLLLKVPCWYNRLKRLQRTSRNSSPSGK